MAFLTLNGTTVPVDTSQATRNEDEVGGQDVRAFAGGLRSTVQWAKKSWTVTTPPLRAADQATVLAQTGVGVTVAGDISGGASVTCTVRSQNGPYRKSWGATVKRRLTLTIREE
jgi:hypothetical protein